MVAVGTNHGYVQIWDVAANKQINKLQGHSARVGALAWNGEVLSSDSKNARLSVYMSAIRHNVTVRNLEKEFDVENEDSYDSNSNSNNGENLKSPTKVLDNEEQYRSQARQLTSVVTMWSSSYSTSPAKASQGKDVYSDRFVPFRQGNNWETKFTMISVKTQFSKFIPIEK